MYTIDFKIWSVSILLAAFLHGILFMQTGNLSGMKLPDIESLSATRLNFKQMHEPVPDKKIIPPEKPVTKTRPVPKPVINKTSKNVVKKKLPVEEIVKPVSTPQSTSSTREKQLVDLSPVVDQSWLKRKREIYFGKLIGHIEKHKFYPSAARRRGIMGKVSISFQLGDDGGITNLHIISKHKILKQAATEALESALPMPLPEQGVLNSRQIKFNMLYAMQ